MEAYGSIWALSSGFQVVTIGSVQTKVCGFRCLVGFGVATSFPEQRAASFFRFDQNTYI